MFEWLPFVMTAVGLPGPASERPVRRMTPVLVVERIEPALALWVDRLGFEKTTEVPEGDHLGFVILSRDGLEIMYQTRESVLTEVETAGLPETLVPSSKSQTVLFCEVPDLESIRRKLEGFEILLSYRKTSYGAEELWMREPGGHIIGFAQFPGEAR